MRIEAFIAPLTLFASQKKALQPSIQNRAPAWSSPTPSYLLTQLASSQSSNSLESQDQSKNTDLEIFPGEYPKNIANPSTQPVQISGSLSPQIMQTLVEKFPSHESAIAEIEKKFLLHSTMEPQRPLEILLADNKGVSLAIAKQIASTYDKGSFVVEPKPTMSPIDLHNLMQFMQKHPEGVIIIPSISDKRQALGIPPEFYAARGLPQSISPIVYYAKMVLEGFPLAEPKGSVLFTKNRFLYVIVDKNFSNPKKVFGFHNENVDTSHLDSDIVLAHMGFSARKIGLNPHGAIYLDNKNLTTKEYQEIIDLFMPKFLCQVDKRKVYEQVLTANVKNFSYRDFAEATTLAAANILASQKKV